MSMRKLFATAALTSLGGALLFGGVLAWKTSDYARGAALVGSNDFEIRYEPNCSPVVTDVAIVDPEENTFPIPCVTLIGPNGATTEVGQGHGINGGDFKLQVIGGSLEVRAVRGPGACAPEDFAGAVRLLNPGEIIPPGGEGGKFLAYLRVKRTAPETCQGDVAFYKVVIEAENPLPMPVDGDPIPVE